MEVLARLGLMLSRMSLMVWATGLDGEFFYLSSTLNDSGVPAEEGVGRGDVFLGSRGSGSYCNNQ